MSSLIRDVLMPAAPALALIAALLMGSSAGAQEGQGEEKIAAAAVVAAQAIPALGAVPADSGRRTAGTDDVESDTTDVRQCRRIERIGKVTIRRCQ